MKEITLPDQYSLTQTLKKLNKAFIILKDLPDKNKKRFLQDFYKIFSQANTPEKVKQVWAMIVKISDTYAGMDDVGDPLVMLRDHAIPTYIGDMTHGVMFCKGMVIGLVLPLTKEVTMSYRLDFAPDKLLHFNFEIRGSEKYPLCIKLNFSTGRFGFTQTDKLVCEKNQQKMETFLEAIKFKFWLKMTIAHTLLTAPRNEINHDKKEQDQLLDFLRGESKYDFDTLKAYIIKQLPEDASKLLITASQTEQQLLTCIMQTPVIRAATRESIFVTLSSKDETKRMLQNQYYLQDVIPTDSDQRLDSEQPPANQPLVPRIR